ncbi:MAG: mechanosensitive ion channel family protein [Ignavibacteria bacterium]|nr:mechanosensitive ion channel family protein [Ignavibacteria bacterium]
MSEIIDVLLSFSGSVIAVFVIIIFLIVTRWIFKRIEQEKEKRTITRQVIYAIIILLGALALTISLPIEQTLKGQMIGLIGIVLSAAFAFSSTTLIGNALAGLMNANIKNFNLGDFIRIENNFGRVTKKGLFRTEIQTEDRNLTSLPNLYIANNPLKIIRESGTIISTTVSLGYDLNRSKVEAALLEAAENTGLTEPFVYITNLGDFSVTYKINGLLTEIDKYFTVTSKLNANVMDHLHKAGVEIVSPSFMNQRQVNDIQFIPKIIKESRPAPDEKLPEELVFDKAIKADKIDDKIESLEKIDEEIKQVKLASKDAGDKEKINKRIKTLEELKEKINSTIVDDKKKLDEEK